MAAFAYTAGLAAIMGSTDLSSATVQAMLVTSGYTPDIDHDFVSETTPGSNELSGTGYSRKTLGTKTITKDDTNNRAVFDAADLTWTSIDAGTAAAVILFIFVTGDSDSILLLHIDNGGFPAITDGGDLTIAWSVNGIFYLAG
jgi:hypothetical protein